MQAGTGDDRHVPRVWPCPVVEGKARRSQPGEVYPDAET